MNRLKKLTRGWSDLHCAADTGDLAQLRLAVQNNADLNKQDKNCQTALHLAAGNGFDLLVRELVTRRADVTIQDEKGNTALHLACNKESVKAVMLLLGEANKLADKVKWINTKNRAGYTALMEAASRGNHTLVQELLNYGGDPFKSGLDGKNALHLAARAGHLPLVKLLVEVWQMDVNNAVRGSYSRPIHFAARKGDVLMVQALFAYGADPSLQNENGLTALQVAQEAQHHMVVSALSRMMGDSTPPLGPSPPIMGRPSQAPPLVVHPSARSSTDALQPSNSVTGTLGGLFDKLRTSGSSQTTSPRPSTLHSLLSRARREPRASVDMDAEDGALRLSSSSLHGGGALQHAISAPHPQEALPSVPLPASIPPPAHWTTSPRPSAAAAAAAEAVTPAKQQSPRPLRHSTSSPHPDRSPPQAPGPRQSGGALQHAISAPQPADSPRPSAAPNLPASIPPPESWSTDSSPTVAALRRANNHHHHQQEQQQQSGTPQAAAARPQASGSPCPQPPAATSASPESLSSQPVAAAGRDLLATIPPPESWSPDSSPAGAARRAGRQQQQQNGTPQAASSPPPQHSPSYSASSESLRNQPVARASRDLPATIPPPETLSPSTAPPSAPSRRPGHPPAAQQSSPPPPLQYPGRTTGPPQPSRQQQQQQASRPNHSHHLPPPPALSLPPAPSSQLGRGLPPSPALDPDKPFFAYLLMGGGGSSTASGGR